MNDTTRLSLEIFKKILQDERISEKKNESFYDEYKTNSEIQNDLNEICEIFDLRMYEHNQEGIFMTPGVDNKLFGYSNSELKKKFNAINDRELSLHLFIMYCLFTRIYKESTALQPVDFITRQQVIDSCEQKISLIKNSIEQDNNVEESLETSFKTLVKEWDNKTEINLKSKSSNPENDDKSQSKIAYINRVLKFFCENNLLYKAEFEDSYIVQERMTVIASYYYDEVANRSKITEYLDMIVFEDDEF